MAAFTGFPLLRKELVEQAARWRTYLVRILFSLFLLGLVVLYLPEFLTRFGLRDSPEAFLGSGRAIFNLVTNVLFIGIHLVLPALMAGALSAERERGSLDLLRVTDLGPTEILLEKYLSRLVLMLTLLLTALPLLALAYSFGGVSADRLQRTAVLLLLACLQVGAISLFCSARCKTVLRAVIWAYLGCLAFYCILPLILILFPAQEGLRYLYPFLLDLMSQWPYWSPSLVFLATLFILLSCLLFLFLARQAFVGSLQHRAVPGSGGTGPGRPRSSRRVDPDRKLPGDRPVAWREAGRGRLTRAPFFSLIIGGEFLLFFNLLALAGGEIQYASSFMVVLNWMVAGLVVPLRSVNAVASERVRQTLDVLLTTPLTGMEILRQKVRGLWPTWWIFFWFMAPFYLMKALWLMSHHDFWGGGAPIGAVPYLVMSLLSVWIYLPLITYLSLWIGLIYRHPVRAPLCALFAVFAWALGPFFALELMSSRDPGILWLLSPISIIIQAEVVEIKSSADAWMMMLLNYAWYGSLLLVFRWLCLGGADHYLKRGK